MQVVGVDFGTSNVRIATWDSDHPYSIPEPRLIGRGSSVVMPTVIAFRRETGGEISWVVGEDADELTENSNTLVIPDIKRWALASDPFVKRQLDLRDDESPEWWDPETRCVRVWDSQPIHVTEIMHRILAEAFSRAGIAGEFEWRAGCPVHAGLDYRTDLAQVLSAFGGRNNIGSIVEEPLLFLALARKIGNLEEGSYLVYDLGGGSFDCALAQIGLRDGETQEMVVYSANGDPRLGGFDIDNALYDKFSPTGLGGPRNQLRIAKEQVNSLSGARNLSGAAGVSLSYPEVVEMVDQLNIFRRTMGPVKETYLEAKLLWGRPRNNPDVPPIGDRIYHNGETGAVRFVKELRWSEMAQDSHLNGVILFGGATLLGDTSENRGSEKTRYFREKLVQWFGEDKVFTATELIPGVGEPELVGASLGACYMAEGSYSSIYVNRLPMRVTLENLQTGERAEYMPFDHFRQEFGRSFATPTSESLIQQTPAIRALYPKTYELTVTYPNGVVWERRFIDEQIKSRLIDGTLRLVIDRLGRIGVEQESSKSRATRFLIIESTPWQTELQKEKVAQQPLLNEVRENIEKTPFGDLISYSSGRLNEAIDASVVAAYGDRRRRS